MYRSEPSQFVRALERHDHTNEKRDEGNNGNGCNSDGHCLMTRALKTQAAFQRRGEYISDRPAEQLGESADIGKAPFRRGSDIEKRFHRSLSVFQSMFFGVDYVKDSEEICQFQDVVDGCTQSI